MKDFKVLKVNRYADDTVKNIVPGMVAPYNVIEGINNLEHRVLKIILTPLGSNSYYPKFGTAINNLKRVTTSTAKEKEVRVALNQVIRQAQEQIVKEQADYNNLSLDELLDKIEIINILFNEDTNIWEFRLAIYNKNNQISVLEL